MGKSSSRLDTSTLTVREPEKHSIVTPSKRLDNASKQLRHNGAVLRLTDTTLQMAYSSSRIKSPSTEDILNRGSLYSWDAMWRIERELSTRCGFYRSHDRDSRRHAKSYSRNLLYNPARLILRFLAAFARFP